MMMNQVDLLQCRYDVAIPAEELKLALEADRAAALDPIGTRIAEINRQINWKIEFIAALSAILITGDQGDVRVTIPDDRASKFALRVGERCLRSRLRREMWAARTEIGELTMDLRNALLERADEHLLGEVA